MVDQPHTNFYQIPPGSSFMRDPGICCFWIHAPKIFSFSISDDEESILYTLCHVGMCKPCKDLTSVGQVKVQLLWAMRVLAVYH